MKYYYFNNYHSKQKMFDEEIFINKCYIELHSKSYVNYEDVNTDIELFIENNLPTELKSISYITYLHYRVCNKYYNYDSDNMSSIEEDEDEDDILYRAADIWLAATETSI